MARGGGDHPIRARHRRGAERRYDPRTLRGPRARRDRQRRSRGGRGTRVLVGPGENPAARRWGMARARSR